MKKILILVGIIIGLSGCGVTKKCNCPKAKTASISVSENHA